MFVIVMVRGSCEDFCNSLGVINDLDIIIVVCRKGFMVVGF